MRYLENILWHLFVCQNIGQKWFGIQNEPMVIKFRGHSSLLILVIILRDIKESVWWRIFFGNMRTCSSSNVASQENCVLFPGDLNSFLHASTHTCNFIKGFTSASASFPLFFSV